MEILTNHFVEVLLSGLTLAFTAWASLVWSMGNKALRLLSELKERLVELTANHQNLNQRVDNHLEKPWHASAGEEISSLKARVSSLERK